MLMRYQNKLHSHKNIHTHTHIHTFGKIIATRNLFCTRKFRIPFIYIYIIILLLLLLYFVCSTHKAFLKYINFIILQKRHPLQNECSLFVSVSVPMPLQTININNSRTHNLYVQGNCIINYKVCSRVVHMGTCVSHIKT